MSCLALTAIQVWSGSSFWKHPPIADKWSLLFSRNTSLFCMWFETSQHQSLQPSQPIYCIMKIALRNAEKEFSFFCTHQFLSPPSGLAPPPLFLCPPLLCHFISYHVYNFLIFTLFPIRQKPSSQRSLWHFRKIEWIWLPLTRSAGRCESGGWRAISGLFHTIPEWWKNAKRRDG